MRYLILIFLIAGCSQPVVTSKKLTKRELEIQKATDSIDKMGGGIIFYPSDTTQPIEVFKNLSDFSKQDWYNFDPDTDNIQITAGSGCLCNEHFLGDQQYGSHFDTLPSPVIKRQIINYKGLRYDYINDIYHIGDSDSSAISKDRMPPIKGQRIHSKPTTIWFDTKDNQWMYYKHGDKIDTIHREYDRPGKEGFYITPNGYSVHFYVPDSEVISKDTMLDTQIIIPHSSLQDPHPSLILGNRTLPPYSMTKDSILNNLFIKPSWGDTINGHLILNYFY